MRLLRREWLEEEDDMLRQLAQRNVSPERIAVRMKRSSLAVRQRLRFLAKSDRRPQSGAGKMNASVMAREHAARFAAQALNETDPAMLEYYRLLATRWQNIAEEQDLAAALKSELAINESK